MVKGRWNVDRWGAIASAVCAVHCLLTGVALSLLPVIGLQFLATQAAEITFIALALTLGAWAVWHGKRAHGDWRPSLLYLAGIACLLLSHFAFGHSHDHGHAGHNHGAEVSSGSTVSAVMAGLFFISFHLVNARLQKRCGCGKCETRVGHSASRGA